MARAVPPKPEIARQLLPPETYRSEAWFEREQRELFARAWGLACTTADVPNPGDYMTVQIGRYPMFVIRDAKGGLRAYHNTCRHRGTQLVEGKGNFRHGIVCRYHAWTYNLDGSLRGLPKREELFPDIRLDGLGLHKGGLGVLGDLVFVNPTPDAEPFADWLAGIEGSHMWPHRIAALSEKRPVRYEIAANWKIFCENAMDGYHLSYLHDKTLMGPDAMEQDWDAVGRHWVFISHGESPSRTNTTYERIPGVNTGGRHPVVWQFFPNSGVLASSIFFSAYTIEPVGPERCALELRTWMMPRKEEGEQAPRNRPSGTSGHGHIRKDGKRVIATDTLSCHAMESLDFQIEDMYICERQQKGLRSPMFKVGPMARRVETSLTFFQANILDYVPLEGARQAAE
ncbi:MAG: aromatic ring-hydroxylating dioxygenase subunit alpha [Alphaproteobacteria bacterium]